MNYITVRRIRRKNLHKAELVETEKNNENISYHNDLRIRYSYFCNIYTFIFWQRQALHNIDQQVRPRHHCCRSFVIKDIK